jgi:hypothetical protein
MEGTKDFYLLSLSLLISLTTSVVTIYKLADQGIKPHLLMVLFWGVYNMIPPFLFIMYTCYKGGGPASLAGLVWSGLVLAPPTPTPQHEVKLGLCSCCYWEAQPIGLPSPLLARSTCMAALLQARARSTRTSAAWASS